MTVGSQLETELVTSHDSRLELIGQTDEGHDYVLEIPVPPGVTIEALRLVDKTEETG
jgi:hypothetical protein